MSDRRQEILTAALPVFVAKGYAGTTIADIRKASGATTGSLYHFFAGKPGIAIALWQAANADWQRATDAAQGAGDARAMVEASIGGLLAWAVANRPLFLFFEELRIRALTDPDLAPITEEIARTHAHAAGMYRAWVDAGAVRDLPWPVASALMVGPSYDYLLKCGDGADHAEALAVLVERAWSAVAC